MNKQAQRALNKMTPTEKLMALDTLIDSLRLPAIVMLTSGGKHFGRNSDLTTKEDAIGMLAGYIITAAEINGTTPIKLLADLGDAISEIMSNEKSERAKKVDKKRA